MHTEEKEGRRGKTKEGRSGVSWKKGGEAV